MGAGRVERSNAASDEQALETSKRRFVLARICYFRPSDGFPSSSGCTLVKCTLTRYFI